MSHLSSLEMRPISTYSINHRRYHNKNIIIAAHNPDIAPIPFWQQLQMPDYKVLTKPNFKLLF